MSAPEELDREAILQLMLGELSATIAIADAIISIQTALVAIIDDDRKKAISALAKSNEDMERFDKRLDSMIDLLRKAQASGDE